MTTSKKGFTKGPWIMDGWSITGPEAADSMGARSGMYGSIFGSDNPRHCIIAQRDGKDCVAMAFGLDLDHAKANARMLASAPELYEALAELVAWVGNDDYTAKARAALARAAGEGE